MKQGAKKFHYFWSVDGGQRTIQDLYAHVRNLHVVLYGYIIIKIFDTEAITITLLILNLLHFNTNNFFQKNSIYHNYQNI